MSAIRFMLLIGLLLGGSSAVVAEVRFQSGPRQSVMIELYTSEGCSSCPPAERFLAKLREDPRLWQTYFPLAFHVDYWDYLGWKDPYASADNSRRQRRYGQVLGAATIYTPEFFVNGRVWRRGVFGGLPQAGDHKVGRLRAVLRGDSLVADFDGHGDHRQPLLLHIAVLGMDLRSDIAAGENAGRQLTHQFVVLGRNKQMSDSGHWQSDLPKLENAATRKALVLWVSEADDPRPIQATGGYLSR